MLITHHRMCSRPTMFRRLSSRASEGIVAFFSPAGKEDGSPRSHKQKQKQAGNYQESQHYTLHINPVILSGSFLCFVVVAFYTGVVVRILMLSNSASRLKCSFPQAVNPSVATMDRSVKQLPAPTVIPGKEVPPTTYTFKHFPVEGSTKVYDLHLDRSSANLDDKHEHVRMLGEYSEIPSDDSSDDEESIDELMEGLHLPAGQHLLVDIKNVDPIFLNSEDRLAEAMIQLVDMSKLTLLSYHCQ